MSLKLVLRAILQSLPGALTFSQTRYVYFFFSSSNRNAFRRLGLQFSNIIECSRVLRSACIIYAKFKDSVEYEELNIDITI